MALTPGLVRTIAFATLLGCVACREPVLSDATAELTATPAEVDFGATFVGDRVSREVELASNGRAPVTLTLDSAPEGFLVEPASVELAAGGRVTVRVIFAPLSTGEAAGPVVLAGEGAKVSIAVQGTAVGRQVEAPAGLDFGTVFVGEEAAGEVRLVNRSVLPVVFTGEVIGDDTDAFRAARESVELAAGAEGGFPVTFAPTVRATAQATLLAYPCGSCAPLEVNLRGTGVLDRVVAVPAALDFGTAMSGEARTLEVALENRGDLARTVAELRLVPGDDPTFEVDDSALPVTLEPGLSQRVAVTFRAPGAGLHGATLQAVDERGELLVAVPLSGIAETSVITVEPATLDFGTQAVGSSERRTVRVSVSGPAVLVATASIRGTGDAFRVAPAATLPVTVGAPLDLTVSFVPSAAGPYTADLVIGTNHPSRPELRIPLDGAAAVIGPCRLEVPTYLDFGLVAAGTTARAPLAVRNTGTGECRLTGISVEQPPGSFSVTPVATPFVVAPGASREFEVVYAPPADQFRNERALLRILSNDPVRPTASIDLFGEAGAANLAAIPDPVDFGNVAVGHAAFRAVEVRNQGETPARIVGVGFATGTPAVLQLAPGPAVPLDLLPGDGVTLAVKLAPVVEETIEGVLEVRVEGATRPKRVEVRGRGVVAQCGVDCHTPAAICPGRVVTEVAKEVRLTGAALDPDGDPTTCRWSLRSAPVGSTAPLATSAPCGAVFTADLVGDYRFELAVTDSPTGYEGRCIAEVHADPYSGLWLETFWNRDADVDLHLLNPAHHAGIDPFDAWSWGGTDGADCFYWTCRRGVATLAWPDTPGTDDDPSLDFDSQHVGPENIRVDVPAQGHPYWIGVHWLYNPLGHASVDVTTNVYCGGVMAATQTVTLLHREHAVLGKVDVNPDGTCAFTASGVRLSY
jgi:hypothetical protein